MANHGKPRNFAGLLEAWLTALDTEELNKRFYRELDGWFKRCLETAEFPSGQVKTLQKEEHVIRLITRLMFVWFIKEKGLVSHDLFNEHKVGQLLKNYDRAGGDSYYRAVLQNLFFATLNTEIGQRRFGAGNHDDQHNPSLYRYHDEISDPDRLVELFSKTPFINGGLFDCLDSLDATGAGGYHIDCFSDNRNHRSLLSIPNRLFFSDAPQGNERGLIDLFNRYKFTVEENTPTEQEVALDPELLGKVFENLLAAVNPETQLTARKETGSYYTPRAVVDYMVDEALVATMAQKASPEDGDADRWQARLRYLLDYGDAFADADTLFTPAEREAIVRVIAGIKALDPAVGSGAFPMGILHKLTLALRRLDDHNELWQALQKELAGQRAVAAFDTEDQKERENELAEISRTFDKYRGSDFGRKLYLIQNSIYGVDIQPIATQIAKLRFFISLTIEQQPSNDPGDNYGIKPLPNLETRFVAANTLMGIEKPLQTALGRTNDVIRLETELAANRERYFHANTRSTKLACREQDDILRKQLAAALQTAGFPADSATQVAAWDPFDQNANAARWFDAEYMFGVTGGFDVAIGNPPYVRADSGDQHLKLRREIENSNQYETLWEKWDLYIAFMERSYKLLKEGGFATLIISDAYCHAKYAQRSREWFLAHSRIARLDFFSKVKIFEAAVRNITYLFQKSDGMANAPERRVHHPEFGAVNLLPTDQHIKLTQRVFFPEDTNVQQFSAPTIPLEAMCYISVGMVVHADEKRAKGAFGLKDLLSDQKDQLHTRPFVEGKHLDRWLPSTHKWIEWGTDRAPNLFRRPTFPELYEAGEKILAQRSPGPDPKTCYDENNLTFDASSVGFILWRDMSGVRNGSIKKQTRYSDEKPRRPDLPHRENLEDISRRFSITFLLGVMNSTIACNFLRANRRSNVHLYPDDWKKLPIPDVTTEQQTPIVDLVDRILKAKAADPAADTSEDEAEIDRLVHTLYGLIDEEIAAVAGA